MDKQLLERVLDVNESASVADNMVKAFEKFDKPNSLRGFHKPPRKLAMYKQIKKDYASFWKLYKSFKDSFSKGIPKSNKLMPHMAEFVRHMGDLFSLLDGSEDRIEYPPNKLKMEELHKIELCVKTMEHVFRYLYVREYKLSEGVITMDKTMIDRVLEVGGHLVKGDLSVDESSAKFKVGDKVKFDKTHPLVKTAKREIDLNKVYTITSVEKAFFGSNSIILSEPYVYYFKEMKYNAPEGSLQKAK